LPVRCAVPIIRTSIELTPLRVMSATLYEHIKCTKILANF
jgi:hypothetical protein